MAAVHAVQLLNKVDDEMLGPVPTEDGMGCLLGEPQLHYIDMYCYYSGLYPNASQPAN